MSSSDLVPSSCSSHCFHGPGNQEIAKPRNAAELSLLFHRFDSASKLFGGDFIDVRAEHGDLFVGPMAQDGPELGNLQTNTGGFHGAVRTVEFSGDNVIGVGAEHALLLLRPFAE